MINAHVGLTYACNMNCEHCYVKGKKHKAVKTNSDILLNRLEHLGTFYITYTMGETLLWSGFYDFARKANKKGFYQILLSNGSTIQSEEVVRRLTAAGIKKVGISIDSSEPSKHDKNRNFSGAYQLANNAIRLLAAEPQVWLQVAMTIGNHNLCEVPLVIENMKMLGVTSFSFLWLRENGTIAPIDNIYQYEEIMKMLILMHNTGAVDINVHDYRMNYIVNSLYTDGQITQETRQDFLNMNSCHALSDLILVDPSGDMYACNFADKPFANIYTSELEEIAEYQLLTQPLCGGQK